MRIGIDIDGTLTNIVDSVIAYGQEYELENNLEEGIANAKSDYIETAFEWGTEIGSKFWRENFAKINQVGPRPLTKKYLDKLREEGHEIYIITARSKEELKDPEAISVKWLKKHKVPFDKIFVDIYNKGQLCKEQGVDLFIDDLPRNLDSTLDHGIKTFVMNSVTNENYKREGVIRVYSFVDFYRQIKKMSQDPNVPKTYVMNVNKKYYRKLKSETKRVELRLNDIRRHKIKENDIINFRLDGNPKKYFFARVKRVSNYKNFVDLVKAEGKERCGFENKTIEQVDNIMHRFYTEDEIKKYGVVAIEIEKLK
jgi:ASC-1-like (ASCH) protein/uncharacterized HAD superfamily protein